MTETLNEKALEAAHETAGWGAPHNKERTTAAIRVYLSSLPAGDYTGLVERSRAHVETAKAMGMFGVASRLVDEQATAIAALVAERDELQRKLFPHAEANPISGFSYRGFYFVSDEKGIAELRRLENNANQIEVWRRSFEENLAAFKTRAEAAEAQVKAMDEAMKQIIERSHNDPLGTSKVNDMRRIAENARAVKGVE